MKVIYDVIEEEVRRDRAMAPKHFELEIKLD